MNADSRCFIDTNILLYIFSAEGDKASQAETVLNLGGTISVQVLNELTNVMRRKFAMSWDDVHAALALIKSLLDVKPLTLPVHEHGLALAQRYTLSIYDSMIVAAALEAGCDILWSEDMQHGMAVEGLTICNPFMSPQDLSAWRETAYLRSSPRNAQRINEAIAELQANGGQARDLIDD